MKRSNGEGTIFKRSDGRWCAAFYDSEPVPKRHFVYADTQKEVKQKLKEKMANPVHSQKTADTLAKWLRFYLENFKKNEVKITTFTTYLETFQKHIEKSSLGKVKLERITATHLQQYYNGKAEEGYNPRTIRHMYVLINSAMEKAYRLGYISMNPNPLTVLPKKKSFEGKTLTPKEASKIVNEAKEDELYPIVVLTMYTGLRKGEVMALKWQDINFDKKELLVRGSLCRVIDKQDEKGKMIHKYEILEPKTAKSKRAVPLMDTAIIALKMQKYRQDLQKEKYGELYQDQDLVFANFDGGFIPQRSFMNYYHEFLERFGITQIRFHDLRHTFASLLLEAGESPKVVQELLGHTNISTTMDIYTHITMQGKVKAVSTLDSLMGEQCR